MAITIHQQPDKHSAISTPLILTAASTNSSNDGFRYKVKLEMENGDDLVFIISQNQNGMLVYDVAPSVRQYMRNNIGHLLDSESQGSVHSIYASVNINIIEQQNYYNTAGFQIIGIKILEGWNIAGVFTENEGSQVDLTIFVYNFLDFTIRNGYKPSLLAQIGHEDGDQSRLMSDRLPSTYYWQYAETVGLSLPNNIFVPVRESDWGVWDIRAHFTTDAITEPYYIKLSILPNIGSPVQQDYLFNDVPWWSHLPIYPANLNASTIAGIPKPEDYPNWKAIYFQVFNIDDEQVSMNYVMFNVDRPQTGICNCHDYTPIRLAWVGRRGGWEYYNFNMLSEQEYATEQKVSKRIVGNYGDVSESNTGDFTFDTFDESERVVYKKIDKFITCSTDKLRQGEWEFLKGLILSKQVHWVHDDGTHTPVIVQDSNIRVRNINAKTLEPLTIRIKVAQEQPN
jgi:hypothetical protein